MNAGDGMGWTRGKKKRETECLDRSALPELDARNQN